MYYILVLSIFDSEIVQVNTKHLLPSRSIAIINKERFHLFVSI